jgi:hypothetical protein
MLEPIVIMMRIPPTVMLVGVPEAHRWVLIASIAAAGVIWNLCVGYSLVFKGRSIIAKFCSWHSSAYLSLCLTVLSSLPNEFRIRSRTHTTCLALPAIVRIHNYVFGHMGDVASRRKFKKIVSGAFSACPRSIA